MRCLRTGPTLCIRYRRCLQANLTPGLHRAHIVGYTWGEGDAAAALLPPAAAASQVEAAPAPETAPAEASSEAARPAASPPSPQPPPSPAAAAPCFDVIVAADVVYQPESYLALAATLRAVAAPHTLLYIAFKNRGALWG